MFFGTGAKADAWFLDCCRHWCCNRCCTNICVTPYNAFTPICCGNISAQGCCPINMCGGYCPMPCAPSCFHPGYGGMNPYGGHGGYAGGNCGYGSLPAPSAVATVPHMPAQTPVIPGQPVPITTPGQSFVVPNPQIINQGGHMLPQQMAPGYGFAPVQPIAYYGGYQPQYNPYAYSMMPAYYGQGQAPAYWYGR